MPSCVTWVPIPTPVVAGKQKDKDIPSGLWPPTADLYEVTNAPDKIVETPAIVTLEGQKSSSLSLFSVSRQHNANTSAIAVLCTCWYNSNTMQLESSDVLGRQVEAHREKTLPRAENSRVAISDIETWTSCHQRPRLGLHCQLLRGAVNLLRSCRHDRPTGQRSFAAGKGACPTHPAARAWVTG